jgi:hypothetical protein
LENILNIKESCIEDLSLRNNCDIRNEIIINLKESFGLPSRQMASITNIIRGTVLKIYNEMDSKNRPR